MPHRLLILGLPAELRASGEPHKFANSKHLALLAYLTLQPGEYWREHLTKLIWTSRSSASMDNALSELRSIFGPEVFPPRLRKVSFDPALVECDVVELLALGADPYARREALRLYRGPLLEGVSVRGTSQAFQDWVTTKRAELEAVFLQFAQVECSEAAEAGDWQRVRNTAEHALAAAPEWREGRGWLERAEKEVGPALPRAAVARRAEPSLEKIQPKPQIKATRLWIVGVVGVFAALLGLWFLMNSRRPTAALSDDPPPITEAELPPASSPITKLSDWLRTDGRWLYYRYAQFLPGACEHETQAVGNFAPEGWSTGLLVHCLGEVWLAVDGLRLAERFGLGPETTYCMNFLYVEDNRSYWGQHGAEAAPGLDSIRVVAPNGTYNIGFAVLRDDQGKKRIILTNEYPGSRC